jgi:recombination protein RecA
MSGALKQLTAEAGKRGATVFWTNQMREKIGIMYGDKTTTPAGRALKHYASIRANIKAMGKVKEKVRGEDVIVCSRNKVDVKKNKVAPPFKTAEFCISFGHGIDIIADVLDTAIAMKIVAKRGAWFSFDSIQLGQGRAASLDLLRNTPDLVKSINDKIAEAKSAGVKPEVADDVELQDPNAGGDPDEIEGVEEGAEVQDV